MAFTYVTLQATYESADDQPARGRVEFTPIDQMRNGLTVVSATVGDDLDSAGAMSIRLAATTDPATVPVGVTYRVAEKLVGQQTRTYYVSVPHDAGSTLQLADLTVLTSSGSAGFALRNATDYDDSVAPTDGQAMVWDSTTSKFHPEAVAAGGAVSSVNGQTGAVSITTTNIGAQAVDSDLTAVAALTPTDNDLLQRKAGAWTNRTPTQVKTDLALDHGELAGLGDDDHPIYLTQARGDARYYTETEVDTALAGKASVSHTHATAGTATLDPLAQPDVGDTDQRLGIAAYFYPTLPSTGADNYWNRTIRYGGAVGFMVANPGDPGGPGLSVNSDYTAAIARAQASGVKVLGYVSTRYAGTADASRTTTAANADVDTWLSLYPGIDGIFFDEATADSGHVAYYQTVYNHVKATLPAGRNLVVINPGNATLESYMAACDVVMDFEGDPTTYRAHTRPAWTRTYPSRRFWHIVHTVTSLSELDEMIALTRDNRAGVVQFHSDGMPFPYGVLPTDPFWSHQVEAVAAGAAQSRAKPTVTGSRGSNAALASLLTQLATLGLITDSTT